MATLRHRRGARWWLLCFAHNCVVHPLLPFADLIDEFGAKRVSGAIYWLHDNSYPDGE